MLSDTGAVASDKIALLQTRVRDLEAVLNQNNAALALAFRLPPAQANLFGLLLSLPVVTHEAIQHRLEIATDPKIAIHRLRKRLRPWHARLGIAEGGTLIHGQRHVGYWIEPTMRPAVKAIVDAATSERNGGLPPEVPLAA
jgi:hypothetical protein